MCGLRALMPEHPGGSRPPAYCPFGFMAARGLTSYIVYLPFMRSIKIVAREPMSYTTLSRSAGFEPASG